MSRPQASILIVEDHGDSREALAKVLRLNGYEVVSAANTREARHLAAHREFQLVICDLGLPDGAGHELFAELRRAHGMRGIAVTGLSISDTLQHIQESGFDAYLLKPLLADTLMATIQRVLTQPRAHPRADIQGRRDMLAHDGDMGHDGHEQSDGDGKAARDGSGAQDESDSHGASTSDPTRLHREQLGPDAP